MNIPNCHRPYCMTILLHDHAFPVNYGKASSPRDVAVWSNMTMETLRTLTNEQIGEYVRTLLTRLDENKQRIEG